jgi:hypothetical protein
VGSQDLEAESFGHSRRQVRVCRLWCRPVVAVACRELTILLQRWSLQVGSATCGGNSGQGEASVSQGGWRVAARVTVWHLVFQARDPHCQHRRDRGTPSHGGTGAHSVSGQPQWYPPRVRAQKCCFPSLPGRPRVPAVTCVAPGP